MDLESGISPVSPGGTLETGSFPAVMESPASLAGPVWLSVAQPVNKADFNFRCFDNLLGSLVPCVLSSCHRIIKNPLRRLPFTCAPATHAISFAGLSHVRLQFSQSQPLTNECRACPSWQASCLGVHVAELEATCGPSLALLAFLGPDLCFLTSFPGSTL